MAEAFLVQKNIGHVEVFSAGLKPENGQIDPYAIQVLRESGIDISTQKVKSIALLSGTAFDLVISLTKTNEPSEKSSKLELTAFRLGMPIQIQWSIPDLVNQKTTPSATLDETLISYRNLRDTIRTHINNLVVLGGLDALVIQKRRFYEALNNLNQGIIIHDENRMIRFFSEEAETITGYKPEEAIGKDCHEVFNLGGLCGSQCSFCSASTEDGKCLIPNTKQNYEVSFTSKDGTDKKLQLTVAPITLESENINGVILSMQDVTELSELRFQQKKEHGSQQFHNMVGISEPMLTIFKTIQQVGPSDYPVLITGESGTGKELVATAMHEESRRKGGPFIAVNCGALPENILESELFGHVKGAFTGAIRDKKGRFELAHRGTIFLDEVGDLSPSFQVKLLRVLQEKRFEPIGGEKTITVDVRVISATNKDIRKLVADGLFREDLFYRLSVVPIKLPPLRERREDIPHLIDKILDSISRDMKTERYKLSSAALDLLMRHSWPGNIRELINAIQFSTISCRGEEIAPEHLPPEIRNGAISAAPILQGSVGATRTNFLADHFQVGIGRQMKLKAEDVERVLIETGGNKVKAAHLLGVGRATLYRFLSKYNQETETPQD